MTNPFSAMAAALAAKPVSMTSRAEEAPDAEEEKISRVERIRRLLKSSGAAMKDAEIAWDLADHFPNFGAHLVWLLLKYDIAKGRVLMIQKGVYKWNAEYESAKQKGIRAAIKLLKANGYTVIKP
jgi:hypothetical protein